MHKRLYLIGGILGFFGLVIAAHLCLLMRTSGYLEAAHRQSQTTVTAGYAEGTIYDRNFSPLVNRETAYFAASPVKIIVFALCFALALLFIFIPPERYIKKIRK